MTQPPDFDDVPISSQSENSIPTVLLIVGGLGCGCLGLIFILGIIGAIALPSFLGQVNKAKQVEAKSSVDVIIKGQQAYQLEKGTFSDSIEELNLGVKSEAVNYRYQIVPQGSKKRVMITAQAKNTGLKSYTGAVFTIRKDGVTTTVAGICETDTPSTTPPAMPKFVNNGLGLVECPPGSKFLRN
jgi:type II secretory pathway pseudopilin PulG